MRLRLFIAAAAALLCACGSSSAHSSTTGSAPATTTSATAAATTMTSTAPDGSSGAGTVCGPGSARTVASDHSARVFTRGGAVYGCARGAAHPFKLGTNGTCIRQSRAAPLALRGNLVAYGLQTCGVDTGQSQLVVRRLTDGRVFADRAASTSPAGPESYVRVTAVLIAPDGAVAWIASGGSIVAHQSTIEVNVYDKRGARQLDSSRAVAPTKLELTGSRLRWKHGATWRSAAI